MSEKTNRKTIKNRRHTTKPNNDMAGETVKLFRLNHIAVAVKSITRSLEFWQDVLGLPLIAIEEVPEQKVKVAMLALDDTHIELLEPLNQESTVAKFIEKRGEGLHHIAFGVENVQVALEALKKSGVKLIDEKPRKGAMGKRIAFIHPKSSGGVLIELTEE